MRFRGSIVRVRRRSDCKFVRISEMALPNGAIRRAHMAFEANLMAGKFDSGELNDEEAKARAIAEQEAHIVALERKVSQSAMDSGYLKRRLS